MRGLNELKTALTARLEPDSELQLLTGVIPAPVFDKLAPQAQGTAPISYPYLIFQVRPGVPIYHHKGAAALLFECLVKAVDRGTSSALAGAISARVETLLHPLAPLEVDGFRTGPQLRSIGVDYAEISAGVEYQHVGAFYRITLIPI